MVFAVKCEDCRDAYVSMSKRKIVKRLIECGTLKNLLDKLNSHNVDTVNMIDDGEKDPPLRQSSRIQDRIKTLATTVINRDDNAENIGNVEERTSDSNNSSFIAEHTHNTGRKMG
jgi:hypothetical protein